MSKRSRDKKRRAKRPKSPPSRKAERPAEQTPQERGSAFEAEVYALLKQLRENHPTRVLVVRQPKLTIGSFSARPDFRLEIDSEGQITRWYIECQDRERIDSGLIPKMRLIRDKQKINQMMFVYRGPVSADLLGQFRDEGIDAKSFGELRHFVRNFDSTLSFLPKPESIELVGPKDLLASFLERGSLGLDQYLDDLKERLGEDLPTARFDPSASSHLNDDAPSIKISDTKGDGASIGKRFF